MTTEQAPSELTDETIRELHRRLPALRSELNARNYPVNEEDFREYAATIAAEVCKIMRVAADRALVASQAQPAAEPAPLTIEFIDTHIGADEGDRDAVHEIVREVEEAHGIRAKRMRGQFIPGFTADESVAFWAQRQPAEPRQDSVHSVESSSPPAAA